MGSVSFQERAINDHGQIVGQAWFFDPSACGPHAFLLTPVGQ